MLFSQCAVINQRNSKLCLIFRIKVLPNTSEEPCLFFVWPLEVVHVIDQDSPFYHLSAAELAHEKFELVAIMEGTSETSSMAFQAK